MTDRTQITDWPAPPSVGRAILVGGTFDPVHLGHILAPERARALGAWRDAWLVYVPAAVSPFKVGSGQVAAADRVEMVRRAVGARERSAVWTDEVDRGGASYTVDTLRRAMEAGPQGLRLALLIGTDQALAFHRWKDARAILSMVEVIVVARDGATGFGAGLRSLGVWSEAELGVWERALVDVGGDLPQSSTRVRELVRAGGVERVPPGWLDAGVAAYIRERGLYAAGRAEPGNDG